jgi:PAS domain S-box-containing protein
MKKIKSPSNGDTLRAAARAKLRKQTDRLRELSNQDLKYLITELGTTQIELEMQNEELRKAQVELEASRNRYADLYDFAPLGYFTLDSRGLIQEVNQTGSDLLGITKRLLANKPFSLVLAREADRSAFRAHIEDVFLAQTRRMCEVGLKKMKGPPLHVRLQSIAAEDSDGKAVSIRTAVTDISDLKQAEEALQVVNKKLQAANAELKHRTYELEGVNRELEAFSYTVSHDLKAPLRSIEGFAQAVLEDYADRLGEAGKDYLTRVHSASRRMAQLIDAMLDMSRLTRGELRERVVDLSSLAQVIVHDLQKKEPERRVEFLIAEKLKVNGDPAMLQVVLENLMENAWKFTGRHAAAKIEFGAVDMDGNRVYYVRDDGAGFDPAYADKLFMPFKRLHSTAEFPGLGIGLAIAHRIISRHNGRMWAEAAPEKGATVFFTL